MSNAHRGVREVNRAFLHEKERSRLICERFPDVAHIIVNMKYRGTGVSSLRRILNFYPENRFFFKMNCLGKGCDHGGLNLTRVITSMIRKRQRSTRGDLKFTNKVPFVDHADISYRVSIKYV